MIAGLQKMTLLDFPGKVACTVFLSGCNYNCPFCHNAPLLTCEAAPLMDTEGLLSFLESRKGLLEGVCITGGEPTLHSRLPALIRSIRALGFAVKLDTNGSRPDVLQALCREGLLDYVAMDVKNSPSRYGQTVAVAGLSLEKTEESLRFLLQGSVPFELRTTVVTPLHDGQTMEEMGRWLYALNGERPVQALYLQPFRDRDTVRFSGMAAPGEDQMAHWADILQPYVHHVYIRGQ